MYTVAYSALQDISFILQTNWIYIQQKEQSNVKKLPMRHISLKI